MVFQDTFHKYDKKQKEYQWTMTRVRREIATIMNHDQSDARNIGAFVLKFFYDIIYFLAI